MAKPVKLPTVTIAPSQKKTSAYVLPVTGNARENNQDSGIDYQGTPGQHVVAIGDAIINYVGPATGYGMMIVYTLTSGRAKGTRIFVGHAQPMGGLAAGQKVTQGSPVATLLQHPLGNAGNLPGWTEVGIADPSAITPLYHNQGHAPVTAGGAAFKKVLGAALTPKETAVSSVDQSTATNQQKLGSSQFLLSAEELAIQIQQDKARMRAEAHIGEGTQWVQQIKDKNGQVVGIKYTTGANAPANVLLINGQPATKNDLSAAWGGIYASSFQDFTGRVATPADVVKYVGQSVYQMRNDLARQPGFATSPAYQQQAPGWLEIARQTLGKTSDATRKLIAQGIGENWDQATFESKLRTLPAYLTGPVFQTSVAQLGDTYKKIYGAPDAVASQAIRETAANGWTNDQWTSYLRSQPQYTTSAEYQANAVGFLDAMGLMIGSRPVLKSLPAGKLPTGGAAVPNSQIVPGKPAPLSPELPYVPTLPGAKGVTA